MFYSGLKTRSGNFLVRKSGDQLSIMNKVFLLSIIALLSSCASIDYNMIANRFETPETNGGLLKGEAGLSLNGATNIELAKVSQDVFIFVPIGSTVSKGTKISHTTPLTFNANLGILSRLDLFIRAPSDAPTTFGVKFQLIGDPLEKRSPGFKLAVAGSVGNHNESQKITTTNVFENGEKTYDTTLEVNSLDASVIAGYRINSLAIFYLNFFWAEYETTADLKQNEQLRYKISGDGLNAGVLAGISIGGEHLKLTIETGATKAGWQNRDNYYYPVGASLSATW